MPTIRARAFVLKTHLDRSKHELPRWCCKGSTKELLDSCIVQEDESVLVNNRLGLGKNGFTDTEDWNVRAQRLCFAVRIGSDFSNE